MATPGPTAEKWRALCVLAFVEHDVAALTALSAALHLCPPDTHVHTTHLVQHTLLRALGAPFDAEGELHLSPDQWGELEAIKSAVRRQSHALLHERRLAALREALDKHHEPQSSSLFNNHQLSRDAARALGGRSGHSGMAPVLLAIAVALDTALAVSHHEGVFTPAIILSDFELMEVGAPDDVRAVVEFMRTVLRCSVTVVSDLRPVDDGGETTPPDRLWTLSPLLSNGTIVALLSVLPTPRYTSAPTWSSEGPVVWCAAGKIFSDCEGTTGALGGAAPTGMAETLGGSNLGDAADDVSVAIGERSSTFTPPAASAGTHPPTSRTGNNRRRAGGPFLYASFAASKASPYRALVLRGLAHQAGGCVPLHGDIAACGVTMLDARSVRTNAEGGGDSGLLWTGTPLGGGRRDASLWARLCPDRSGGGGGTGETEAGAMVLPT